MRIVLENEYGKFEMGGGTHPVARIQEKSGFGLVDKEATTVTFSGQAGRTTTDIRDTERTITLLIDFYGEPGKVEKLYSILHYPVNIKCFFGARRRQISGRILNATEIEEIIYHRWQSLALQFVCDNPYFTDFEDNIIELAKPVNHLPNVIEDGKWYIALPVVATTIDAISKVDNRGNIKTYPVVSIFSAKITNNTPEVYGITVKNITTGKKIHLEYNISVSEVITVDIPKRKITSNMYGDITNKISDDTVLSEFYLDIGINEIQITSLSSEDRISGRLVYKNNYVSAVM